MKKLLFSLLLLIPLSAIADETTKGWYFSKGGAYMVKDSIYKDIYAAIYSLDTDEIRVYFYFLDPKECESEEISEHKPIYINKKLVKYAQLCVGYKRMLFPSTKEGHIYLLNEFKKRNFVEVKGLNSKIIALFSAKNFIRSVNELKAIKKAI